MSDDPAFNIKFVELVKNYPYIYDYRRQDHSKRDVVEKAWSVNSNEVKLSGLQCRGKWKNLRTADARSMKKLPSGSEAKKIKDYYLKDVMKFITLFMKSKTQQGNLPTETGPCVNEDNDSESDHSEEEITASVRNSQEKQKDITTVVRTSQEKNPQTQAQCSNTAGIRPSGKRRKVSTTTLNEADKCFMEYVKSKTSKTNSAIDKSNPDLQFLTSLFPDLEKLTDYHKRQFKKITLELLDELLCNGPSPNSTMMVPIPTPSPVYSNYPTQSNFSTHSCHSFSTREYGEQPTPVQTYLQTFSPDMSDGHDRPRSLTEL